MKYQKETMKMRPLMPRTLFSKTLAAAAVAAVLVTGLSGCSGSSDNGQYFGKHKNGYAQIIEIDGDKLFFDQHWQSGTCGGEEFRAGGGSYSVGQISKDRTTVTWVEEGSWSGSDPLRVEDGIVTLGEKVFTTPDKSEAAKDVDENCIIPKSIQE